MGYILHEVDNFKEYMPLLQALRVKGLELRHIRKIRAEVGCEELNLAKTSFRQLAKQDLHKGKKLE